MPQTWTNVITHLMQNTEATVSITMLKSSLLISPTKPKGPDTFADVIQITSWFSYYLLLPANTGFAFDALYLIQGNEQLESPMIGDAIHHDASQPQPRLDTLKRQQSSKHDRAFKHKLESGLLIKEGTTSDCALVVDGAFIPAVSGIGGIEDWMLANVAAVSVSQRITTDIEGHEYCRKHHFQRESVFHALGNKFVRLWDFLVQVIQGQESLIAHLRKCLPHIGEGK
ncbi:hypothetical protein Pelo_1805 [Pelomyxa schiedti]|nr:hypothetical protein Pelo_1805 [Pelomyxa schiedti]